jgi:outer membrane receptor protein involved in Fe transport
MLSYALMLPSMTFSAEAAKEEEDELEEVNITGTRIQVPGNFTSANPINSVSAEEMRQLGIVNAADALLQLVPQNISAYTPALTGDDQAGNGGAGMETMDRGSFFIGNTIANLRGMDPVFGTRTLTLVDGRRMVSTSNQADVVDMNIIPSNMLQRMDVVTGGASATYGSGAMAGVVNLVLNNRQTGFNLDADYGINEAGDGGSPHISGSYGTPLFGGKGHVLIGAEWQKQSAIRDCAAARAWCAESRALFTNTAGSTQNVRDVLSPLPGYEEFPTRFQMANIRYSQFAPTGTIYYNNSTVTTNYRFTEDGTDVDPYALGFRGGTSGLNGAMSNVMNGDGPLVTSGTPLRPSSGRKTMLMNFEYSITERTTAYVQANYAKTDGLNKNRYTTGNYCVRFNSQGVDAQAGGDGAAGQTLIYGAGSAAVTDVNGVAIVNPQRNALFTNANFRIFLGWSGGVLPAPGPSAPYWIQVSGAPAAGSLTTYGATPTVPPNMNIAFANATNVVYARRRSGTTDYWILESMTLTAPFSDPGVPAVLPDATGRNAYAYLRNLSPEALFQLQSAFTTSNTLATNFGAKFGPDGLALSGASNTAGGGAGLDTIYGPTPCAGFTAVRKVWNPQLDQWTTSEAETMRTVLGVKGRFGRDWRWDVSYQYGQTDSTSKQNNVATNLRLGMAMDAVIDDRPLVNGVANPTFNQPVCRVTRDGIPIIDYQGRPVSSPDDLRLLAEGCTPINVFGTSFATPAAAQSQQQAIDYAFVDSLSTGSNSLQSLTLNTNGTLWQGWGAGPLTGAFGIEVREDKVDNAGTSGNASYYERADLASTWADGFGGRTRVAEYFTEMNLPLVSGQPGVNLWSLNAGVRYSQYSNKGGVGTTGGSASQGTMNWKFQTVFEPFDWVRLRLTRSRDLRAATYRELFINQPRLPDQFAGNNPWRERTAFSTEPQFERWGQVQVGNPNLKPEKSNTLTAGIVLSPGGWAQGMRVSVDYFSIQVQDGIGTPFTSASPMAACWRDSGNVAATYLDGGIDPNGPTPINGLIDDNLSSCQEITFGVNPDGSRNLQDIVSYNSARPQNLLPYQRRGIDVSWQYMFPVSRIFEELPGNLSLTVRGTRALEASGIQINSSLANTAANCAARGGTFSDFNCSIPVELAGQIRNSVFIPGVTASPLWTGTIQVAYLVGDLTTSLSARYIGGATLDNLWSDSPDDPNYKNEAGQFLIGSVDDNHVKPYFNFSLNASYNLKVADMKQFQVFGSINNLFDKTPPFTGGGVSGASASYHDTMGRAYRAGVRLKF